MSKWNQNHGTAHAKLNVSCNGRYDDRIEKGRMNLSSREQAERDTVNVVSLFGQRHSDIVINDPLEELMKESAIEDTVLEAQDTRIAKLVNENQFPDQSMYILEEQLSNLRASLNRIRFYMGDIEDLLPR